MVGVAFFLVPCRIDCLGRFIRSLLKPMVV